MLKNWIRDLLLSMQAKSGVTPNVLIWLAVVALSLLTVFVFLCVTGYVWFSIQFGVVFGGLAILERAARAQASASSSWLLDPRLLNVAMQAGRSLGWQRLIPIALLGFLAAQWVRESRRPDAEGGES
jgi:hypothetical protein